MLAASYTKLELFDEETGLILDREKKVRSLTLAGSAQWSEPKTKEDGTEMAGTAPGVVGDGVTGSDSGLAGTDAESTAKL